MRGLNLSVTRTEESVDLDMTPLLDVVFIMLIFFIVTASFVKERGLDVATSDNAQETVSDPDKRAITIRIEKTGRIWVNETPTEVDGLEPLIKRMHAQNPAAKVLIRPDPKAKTEWMIQALDQANAAGVNASIVSEQ